MAFNMYFVPIFSVKEVDGVPALTSDRAAPVTLCQDENMQPNHRAVQLQPAVGKNIKKHVPASHVIKVTVSTAQEVGQANSMASKSVRNATDDIVKLTTMNDLARAISGQMPHNIFVEAECSQQQPSKTAVDPAPSAQPYPGPPNLPQQSATVQHTMPQEYKVVRTCR